MSPVFIVSHRLAGRDCRVTRDRLRRVVPSLCEHTNVGHISIDEPDDAPYRSLCTFECESVSELEKLRRGWPEDVLVEHHLERNVARLHPGWLRTTIAQQGDRPLAPGIGHTMTLQIRGGSRPLADIKVTVLLGARGSAPLTSRVEGTTDSSGRVSLVFNNKHWQAITAYVTPLHGYWSWLSHFPTDGTVIDIEPLPDGPRGWWHNLIGLSGMADQRGAGLRIGIADTGVGPHPYLDEVRALGAVVGGTHDPTPSATADVEGHGTHVSGIIGARPPAGSSAFVGIANTADISMLRVFPANGAGASQGDIALAIDILALEQRVDLINLSLGGVLASEIELDAIVAAAEAGVLCIAASGNGSGGPIIYPAAYPQVAAISGVGMLGTSPSGSVASGYAPAQPDRWVPGGLYLGSFSDVGPEMTGTAPGVGIISTVPADSDHPAPYMEMSGTSMATPIATAALATLLAKDRAYLALPRDATRAAWASRMLLGSLLRLPLSPLYVGLGLSRALP